MKSFAWIFTALSVFAMALSSVVEAAQSGVVNAERVNVRTQANILSEVVAQVNTGDKVQVLEAIVLEKPIPGNPREWYRIGLPEGAVLWVARDYIDSTSNTVTAGRLNVRAGPSESYTVVARLNRGDKVDRIKESGGWISIKPPADTFAYVASSLVDIATNPETQQNSQAPKLPLVAVPEDTGNTPVLIVDDPNSGQTKILKSTIEGNQPDTVETPVVQKSEPSNPPVPQEIAKKETERSIESVQPEVTTSQAIKPLVQ